MNNPAKIYIDCDDSQLRYQLFDKVATIFEKSNRNFIVMWNFNKDKDYTTGVETNMILIKQEEVK